MRKRWRKPAALNGQPFGNTSKSSTEDGRVGKKRPRSGMRVSVAVLARRRAERDAVATLGFGLVQSVVCGAKNLLRRAAVLRENRHAHR